MKGGGGVGAKGANDSNILQKYSCLRLLNVAGLTKEELQESTEVTCCMMDCIWYVIFRFCR